MARVQNDSCPREYRIDGRVPSNWKSHHRAVVRETAQLAREAAGRTKTRGQGLALLIQTKEAGPAPAPAPIPRRSPNPKACRVCDVVGAACVVCGWEP